MLRALAVQGFRKRPFDLADMIPVPLSNGCQEIGVPRDRASVQAQMKMAIINRMLEGMPDEFSSEDIEARAEVIYQ